MAAGTATKTSPRLLPSRTSAATCSRVPSGPWSRTVTLGAFPLLCSCSRSSGADRHRGVPSQRERTGVHTRLSCGIGRPHPYRGINANMHTVEAFLAAGATGDPLWRDRALRITLRVLGFAEGASWRIPEHCDSTWSPVPYYSQDKPGDKFRPGGATPGHPFEWARLTVHLQIHPGRPRDDVITARCPFAVRPGRPRRVVLRRSAGVCLSGRAALPRQFMQHRRSSPPPGVSDLPP